MSAQVLHPLKFLITLLTLEASWWINPFIEIYVKFDIKMLLSLMVTSLGLLLPVSSPIEIRNAIAV